MALKSKGEILAPSEVNGKMLNNFNRLRISSLAKINENLFLFLMCHSVAKPGFFLFLSPNTGNKSSHSNSDQVSSTLSLSLYRDITWNRNNLFVSNPTDWYSVQDDFLKIHTDLFLPKSPCTIVSVQDMTSNFDSQFLEYSAFKTINVAE